MVIVDGRGEVEAYRQSFVAEAPLFARVQEIGEQLQATTGITFPPARRSSDRGASWAGHSRSASSPMVRLQRCSTARNLAMTIIPSVIRSS
jgi:hypothetical protein